MFQKGDSVRVAKRVDGCLGVLYKSTKLVLIMFLTFCKCTKNLVCLKDQSYVVDSNTGQHSLKVFLDIV